MKKIADIVTSTENTETSISKSRGKVSFGSFKRAEDKELKKIKDLEEQEQLTRIAEDAVYADKIRAQKAASIRMVRERETELARKTREIEEKLVEEEKRVIKAEAKRKRDEFITSSLKNAFGTKNEVNMTPVREEVIDKYLPQLKEIEKKDYPEPFKEEPALNAELAEFKKKINEHLHTIGFASSGGGGIGSIADANDIEDLDDGEFIQFRASDGKFIGATASVSNLALTALDIDGGTDIGAAIADADLFVVDDAAGGTNRKAAASRIKTYIADVTLTTAAQTNITSVGTLTALQIDNLNLNGNTISSTAGTDLLITPLSGQQIVLDGTIVIDAGVVTGATSITSTAFVGDITGDVTGTANVATVATTVTITDNESTDESNALIFTAGGDVDGGNLGLESDGTLTYNPSTGVVTATGFVGALTGNVTGNASGTAATVTGAAQTNITSVGTLTTLTVDNIIINGTNIGHTSDTDAIAIASGGDVTLTQDLILGEASSVNMSVPLLGTGDHTFTGLSAQMLAGGAIAAFKLVCIHTTTSEVVTADASAFATARTIGIAPAAISDTATGTILLQGFIRDDTFNFTTGATLYLSETAGALTETAPTTDGAFVNVVGIALSPDVVYINPSMDVIEHA